MHVGILRHIITVDFQRCSREIFRSLLNLLNLYLFVALLFLGNNERVRSRIGYLWHLVIKIIIKLLEYIFALDVLRWHADLRNAHVFRCLNTG